MADRMFPIVSRPYGEKRRPALVITCGHPGCKNEEVMVVSSNGAPNRSFVTRSFANKGWKVGKKPDDDRCPQHARGSGKTEEKTDMQKTTPPEQTKAEPPRVMSRDERRIIFAEINDVYAGPSGYEAPWSDTKVAAALDVPVAWVTEVRTEFFGDACSNPELEEFRQHASASEKLVATAQELHKEFELTWSKLQAQMDRINEHQRAMSALRKKVEDSLTKGGHK